MWFPKFLDDIIDPSSIFDRIRGKSYHHVRSFTCCVDMYISEPKYRLKYSCSMCIYFLNTIERAFRYGTWKSWYLIDTDNPTLSNDKKIKFIVDPTEKDKSKKNNPVKRKSSPVESTSKKFDDRSLILQEYRCRYKEHDEIQEVKY